MTACLFLLAACGRLGFEAVDPGTDNAPTDGARTDGAFALPRQAYVKTSNSWSAATANVVPSADSAIVIPK